jgi:hypothetical protein
LFIYCTEVLRIIQYSVHFIENIEIRKISKFQREPSFGSYCTDVVAAGRGQIGVVAALVFGSYHTDVVACGLD